MRDFCFNIRSVDCGWLNGSVTLCGKTLDFRMSAVLGDDLRKLLLAVLSVCSDREAVSEMVNRGDYFYDDFPCDTIEINEEGTTVEWNIRKDEGKDRVHVSIRAERYDECGCEAPVCLRGELPCEDFVFAIVAGIDEWLRRHSFMQYFRGWGAPFPLVEFLTAKTVVLHRKSAYGSMEDEISLLMQPVGQ